MSNIDFNIDAVPEADGPGDLLTRTISIDGGTAVVDHLDDRAELTIRLGDRLICAVALSTSEAESIGFALARPAGPTVGDYFDMREQLDGARWPAP